MGTPVDFDVICTVKSCLHVRTGPGVGYPSLGLMSPGWTGHVSETQDGWYKCNSTLANGGFGWSMSYGPDTNGEYYPYLTMTSPTNVVPTPQKTSVIGSGDGKEEEGPVIAESGSANIDAYLEYDQYVDKTAFIKDVRGIHGMPYQFLPSVDQRLDSGNGKFGRKYVEKIISKMPLLLLTPGCPDYMTGYNKEDKASIFSYMQKIASGSSESDMNDLLSKPGRYFTFKFAYAEYYSYVNSMCQMGAQFLGISDKRIDNTPLKNYQWENWVNDSLKGVISQREFVAFYVDSQTQITESFSNSTGESMLSSKAKEISDVSKEVSFLLGAGAGATISALDPAKYQENLEAYNKFADTYLNGNQMFKNIGKGFYSVMTGGKLIFPEIWNDSTFSKSYDISMKLRTPDGDVFSWYMNIYVVLMHIIAMTAPKQMVPDKGTVNANAYMSPFLVRGFYKGLWSCDMGMITSLNISKGAQSSWTPDGLPTEVDVDFTIKDLYPVMAISDQSNASLLMNNTVLIDYLATSCGINVNKPEILRMVDIYIAQKYNSLKSLPSQTFMQIEEALATEWFNLIKNGI
ncbi:MAG: hypothetical protein M0P49_03005 [Bacilli bacterium]|nr:hypothetical protein [Bacilli bacterium]